MNRARIMSVVWLAIVTVASGAGNLQKFTDCRLLDNQSNDGDSFHVKAGSGS